MLAGSTRAARHAGTPHAIIATPASSPITPRYVAGSSRDTPISIATMAWVAADRSRHADRDAETDERHSLANHERDDAPARRPQGRPQPDLPRALRDAAREHAIDPGGREGGREARG